MYIDIHVHTCTQTLYCTDHSNWYQYTSCCSNLLCFYITPDIEHLHCVFWLCHLDGSYVRTCVTLRLWGLFSSHTASRFAHSDLNFYHGRILLSYINKHHLPVSITCMQIKANGSTQGRQLIKHIRDYITSKWKTLKCKTLGASGACHICSTHWKYHTRVRRSFTHANG